MRAGALSSAHTPGKQDVLAARLCGLEISSPYRSNRERERERDFLPSLDAVGMVKAASYLSLSVTGGR